MTIALNIGFKSKHPRASGVLTHYPMIWLVDDFSHFSQSIRSDSNINAMLEWADSCNVIPSAMCLFLTVEDREIGIRMINVREYRSKWEERYKKKWNSIA